MRARLASLSLVFLGAAILAASGTPGTSGTQGTSGTALPRIVALGDSLTSGRGIQRDEAYPAILQDRLDEAGLRFDVVNAGRSGATSADGVRRLSSALEGDVRVLIVALGANDGLRGRPVEELTSNLARIIADARARGIAVLLCGMEALPLYGLDYSLQFHRVYPGLAARFEVPLVPFMLTGVIGREDMMQRDRIHPTAAGARAIADNIWPYLKPLAQAGAVVRAAAPIRYRFSFPEPQHRWMQVEATFSELGPAPLELRMSRSSPGRYSLHDFAKNVYDVHAFGGDGREIATSRPDAYGWTVGGHGDTVTVRYKVYGDRVDGTYLAVDTTHAHINMPAAVMWARGLDDRAAIVLFDPPSGARWQVATQLHAGSTAFEFTAPNLQYLMDSPAEFGPVVIRQFSVGPRTFRFAAHHTGTDGELESFVRDVEKVVRQEGAIYGEYPDFEPGHYTFLADYLPYANGDGMEHRNSTVMTSTGSIARARTELLDTVAHEFFHAWNVERIRPRDLEPFDLDGANTSSALWLAEGFTQYYGPLVLKRAGLADTRSTADTLATLVEAVSVNPGRLLRSAEEMSRMAPFTDGARPVDRTNWSITVTSYYPLGGAIALALDLTLRERSNSQTSLDDFMRAMWRRYGKPGGAREGYVDRPYSVADAEAALAEVSGDPAFARDFFARYIQGHDVADYARLLGRAGFALRPARVGAAWLGDLRLDSRNGAARVAALVAPTWPIYAAGVEEDDEIQAMGGDRIRSIDDVNVVLRRHKPGDRIDVVFIDRGSAPKTASITLGEDPHRDVVALEAAGGMLTPAQKSFRDAWLGPK